MANNPKAVAQAFIEECNGGGVDRIVAFFSDDAVIKTLPPPPAPDPGVYTGKQEIRAWFDPQMQNFHVEPHNLQANGETVTWASTVSGDMFRQMGMDSFDVACAVTVHYGKITAFTITQTPETVEKFQRAMAQGGAGQTGV